jgi:hypothetical protein
MLLAIYIESEPFALKDLACLSGYHQRLEQDLEMKCRLITKFACKTYEPNSQRETAIQGFCNSVIDLFKKSRLSKRILVL